MSNGGNFFTSVVMGVVLAVLVGLGGWVIYTSAESVPVRGVQLSDSTARETIVVKVEAGDSAPTIADRLSDAGVIDSADSFELLARITGADRRLVSGEYEFVAGTSTLDAVTRIRDGLTSSRIVSVPEGLRLEELAALLEKRDIVRADDFLAAANSLAVTGSGVDTDLLSSKPSSSNLEGYLYPHTYSFASNDTPQDMVIAMLEVMAQRFTPALRAEARAQGLSVHEVLTLASIVEREVIMPEERALVASVYLNRLEDGIALQADPTVQYAISSRASNVTQFGFWKQELSLQDLQFDSPYNTYVESGLPPGPIASPSIDSIIAVIRPAQTNYLFFVARSDGSHAFSETFEQHQRNIQLYQP